MNATACRWIVLTLASLVGAVAAAASPSVSYAALPHDGCRGLFRDGTTGAVGFKGFHRAVPALNDPRIPVAQELVLAREYYNAKLDHYFVTASAPDIDAIESGRHAGWQPTSRSFAVTGGPFIHGHPDASSFPDGVCRFYIPPNEGEMS